MQPLNEELAEYRRGYIAGEIGAICHMPNELPPGTDAWRAGWADGWAETYWFDVCGPVGGDY